MELIAYNRTPPEAIRTKPQRVRRRTATTSTFWKTGTQSRLKKKFFSKTGLQMSAENMMQGKILQKHYSKGAAQS